MSGAVCAWARVRGEGGKGDWFVGPVVQWFLKCCRSGDQGRVRYRRGGICVAVKYLSSQLTAYLSSIYAVVVTPTRMRAKGNVFGLYVSLSALKSPDLKIYSRCLSKFERGLSYHKQGLGTGPERARNPATNVGSFDHST